MNALNTLQNVDNTRREANARLWQINYDVNDKDLKDKIPVKLRSLIESVPGDSFNDKISKILESKDVKNSSFFIYDLKTKTAYVFDDKIKSIGIVYNVGEQNSFYLSTPEPGDALLKEVLRYKTPHKSSSFNGANRGAEKQKQRRQEE